MKRCFSPFNINEFDLHSIEFGRLRYDSAEHGLLSSAIGAALQHNRPLLYQRGRHTHILKVDVQQLNDKTFHALKSEAKTITGTVPKTELTWTEAIKFRLELKNNFLWLIIQPIIWVQRAPDDDTRFVVADFVRERMAVRYNAQYHRLLSAWTEILVGESEHCVVTAFGISNGVDAEFKIGKRAAFAARSIE